MWEFDYSKIKGSTNVVPGMIPANKSGFVDVATDFAWTKNAKGTQPRANCPKINLIERRVTVNGLYTQLAYQFTAFGGEAAKLPESVVTGMQSVVSAMGEKDSAEFKLLDSATNALKDARKKVTSTIDNVTAQITGNTAGMSGDSLELSPYKNLYISEPTGFIYSLPYNVEYAFGSTSSFDDPQGNGIVGTLLTTAIKGMKSFTETSIAPGSFKYIENSKQFNFSGASTESFEIKFPLFNTGSYEDIVKNWQFIYLLTYQNTPARVDKSNVEPPCIYELEIPGMKYYPYSYIKDIRIDMLGTRKNYELTNVYKDKNGQSQSVTTVIPEAYMVSITVEALIQQSKNLLYSPLTGSKAKINTNPSMIKIPRTPSIQPVPASGVFNTIDGNIFTA